ncbi:hypothetical protein [Pseudomonas aeruginosa]|nr:hypothetical protein [Pseudomonas aeruginosa]
MKNPSTAQAAAKATLAAAHRHSWRNCRGACWKRGSDSAATPSASRSTLIFTPGKTRRYRPGRRKRPQLYNNAR